jgi:hypothetical protein
MFSLTSFAVAFGCVPHTEILEYCVTIYTFSMGKFVWHIRLVKSHIHSV